MRRLLILCSLLIAGCGDTFETPQKREYTRSEVRVYWEEVKDETTLYARCGTPEAVKKTLACAILSADRGTCTVVTYQGASLDVLGHEFLHCFTGRWHS